MAVFANREVPEQVSVSLGQQMLSGGSLDCASLVIREVYHSLLFPFFHNLLKPGCNSGHSHVWLEHVNTRLSLNHILMASCCQLWAMEVALFCQEWKQRCHPFQSQWHLFDIEAHQMEDVLNLRSMIWRLLAWVQTSAMCPVLSCFLIEKIRWVNFGTWTCKCMNSADSMVWQCSVFYLKTNMETWSHWEDGFFPMTYCMWRVKNLKKRNSAMLPSLIWLRNRAVVLRNGICFFLSVLVTAFSAVWALTIISSQSVRNQFWFLLFVFMELNLSEMCHLLQIWRSKKWLPGIINCSTGPLCTISFLL